MPYPPHHKELINLLLRQEWYLQRIYANLSKDLALILRRYKVKGKKNVWHGNAEVKKELNALMKRYERLIFKHISEQIKQGWNLSDKHNDNLVSNYTKGIKIPEKERQKYYQRNNEALNAFIDRSQNGYRLSDRVWNITKQNQEHIDNFLKAGLSEGRSASKLSQDVRQYLKEPEKRFRRVRDKKTGKLVLSNPAKDYHPGRGVYRSSYKNALRLVRNEINIAYRTADYERKKNMPFVLGVNVKLSPAHPQYDICDELQGEYPKSFKFTGWHPNCLCYTTSKLMDKKDFVKYLKGEKQIVGHTKSIPKRAEKFIKDNSEKINGYKSKPLFIADNFKYISGGFVFKSKVIETHKITEVSKQFATNKTLLKSRKQQFKKISENVYEHLLVSKIDDYKEIKQTAILLAKNGKITEMLPEIHKNERVIRQTIFSYLPKTNNSNPDLRNGRFYYDLKRPKSIRRILKNANKSSKQGAIAIISDSNLDKPLTDKIIRNRAKHIFKSNEYNQNILIFKRGNKLIIINKSEIELNRR